MRPIIEKPLEIKIQSCKDQTFRTSFETYHLTKGEVFVGKFKNKGQLDSFIAINVIRNVPASTDIVKPVPIILRDTSGNQIPLSSEEIPQLPSVWDADVPLGYCSPTIENRTEPLTLVEMNSMLGK
jgi:hypothetical protein